MTLGDLSFYHGCVKPQRLWCRVWMINMASFTNNFLVNFSIMVI
jgi:hypothetical protein